MGDALQLLLGGSAQLYVVVFAVVCALLEVFSRYEHYVRDPEMDGGVAVRLCRDGAGGRRAVGQGRLPHPWCRASIWQKDYLVAIVAVLGTTITPYCFFWQSSEEAEDERIDPAAHPLIDAPERGAGARSAASASTPISAWGFPT